MGRELKRVDLDFSWPLAQVWEGYLNPHYDACRDCQRCAGTGYSTTARLFHEQWYGVSEFNPAAYGADPLRLDSPALRAKAERLVGRSPAARRHYTDDGRCSYAQAVDQEVIHLWRILGGQWKHQLIQADVDALAAAGRLRDFTHSWTPGVGYVPLRPPVTPTAAEVNRWSLDGLGHDSINCGVCIEARCAREGVERLCGVCRGEGSVWTTPAAQELAENWRRRDPPSGPGYQLWETVSEGSPISPVFPTPEALARWLVDHPWGSCDREVSYDQWMAFLRGPGWAPTLVAVNGELHSGVAAVVDGV